MKKTQLSVTSLHLNKLKVCLLGLQVRLLMHELPRSNQLTLPNTKILDSHFYFVTESWRDMVLKGRLSQFIMTMKTLV